MADLPVPATSPEDARRIADGVLARPEFAGARPSWWEQILQSLFDAWNRLIERIGGGGRGSVIGALALVAVVLVVVLIVVRMTRTMRRDPGIDLAMDAGIGRTPRMWLNEALEHETAGRWRDAVRCRYRALLADLAAAGLVDEIAGRTSGEYLTAVRSDVPRAGDAFGDVTQRFETAWYGHGETTRDDVRAFTAAAARAAAEAGIRRSLAAAGA